MNIRQYTHGMHNTNTFRFKTKKAMDLEENINFWLQNGYLYKRVGFPLSQIHQYVKQLKETNRED